MTDPQDPQGPYPELVDNACSVCGSKSFTLASDCTDYCRVEFNGTEWERGGVSTEDAGAPDSVRLFCTECDTYHQLPEEFS